jgi:DNA-binding NtrC family response regulator
MNNSPSILIIDDEVDILCILKDLLEFRGYHVETSENAQEAIQLAKQNRYCVILADLKMPGMNGTQIAEKLKKIQPASQIIIMSGYGIQVKEALEKIGIQHYIVKPINFDQLFDKINDMCKR